jgi:hypothetical protein
MDPVACTVTAINCAGPLNSYYDIIVIQLYNLWPAGP